MGDQDSEAVRKEISGATLYSIEKNEPPMYDNVIRLDKPRVAYAACKI